MVIVRGKYRKIRIQKTKPKVFRAKLFALLDTLVEIYLPLSEGMVSFALRAANLTDIWRCKQDQFNNKDKPPIAVKGIAGQCIC